MSINIRKVFENGGWVGLSTLLWGGVAAGIAYGTRWVHIIPTQSVKAGGIAGATLGTIGGILDVFEETYLNGEDMPPQKYPKIWLIGKIALLILLSAAIAPSIAACCNQKISFTAAALLPFSFIGALGILNLIVRIAEMIWGRCFAQPGN